MRLCDSIKSSTYSAAQSTFSFRKFAGQIYQGQSHTLSNNPVQSVTPAVKSIVKISRKSHRPFLPILPRDSAPVLLACSSNRSSSSELQAYAHRSRRVGLH